MKPQFEFDGLFILDLANNHQGDLEHGLDIIRSLASIVRKTGVKAAIKFQFRQLDTFIHPEFVERRDIKHIPRFLDTQMSRSNYQTMLDTVRELGLISMCTPFDEESVQTIMDMDFDVIKIASCSIIDLPLIHEVAKSGKPIVASTGGAQIDSIERVVKILKIAKVDFALEHCVSIYPTPPERMQLNQIEYLNRHFLGIPVGWSTHEDPDDITTIKLAVAKGATLFERHVGIANEKYKLNAYSSTPDQIERWIESYQDALERCGSKNRGPSSLEETEALVSLMRGVYVNQPVGKDETISKDKIFFAMPLQEGGMTTAEWRDNLVANKDYGVGEKLDRNLVSLESTDEEFIDQILLQVQGMLHDARINIGNPHKIELSHHYGLRRFREFGAVIIDIINRDYCKKLIVQLPRQKHPYHYHKQKEETFHVLYGQMEIEKEGDSYLLNQGDLFLVEQNKWHKFSTLDGVIFEEISTTHFDNDSFYQDQKINSLNRSDRKTAVEVF